MTTLVDHASIREVAAGSTLRLPSSAHPGCASFCVGVSGPWIEGVSRG